MKDTSEECDFCGNPQLLWPRHCRECGAPCCLSCLDILDRCPECAEKQLEEEETPDD
jgi:predicted Zn-ribbon and HTH transcriptional regulator